MKRCTCCGRNTNRFADFPCPSCGDELVRCSFCRENKNKYECKCSFKGP